MHSPIHHWTPLTEGDLLAIERHLSRCAEQSSDATRRAVLTTAAEVAFGAAIAGRTLCRRELFSQTVCRWRLGAPAVTHALIHLQGLLLPVPA